MSTATDPEANGTTDAQSKPPFLRRVRIRGYKSIAFCDVTLEPLTILVGRNASGKSNFLDALGFLRDLMEMRATEAVNERKGWRAIHCRNGATPRIEIGLEATYRSHNSTWDAVYLFALEIGDQNQIRVHHEKLLLQEQGSDRKCGYSFQNGKFEWIGQEHFDDESADLPDGGNTGRLVPDDKLEHPQFFGRRRYDRLLLSVIGTQPFIDLSEGLRASCVYNFAPAAIRDHQPITSSPILKRDGRNLARAIEGLREIEPKTVDRLIQYLRAIVPSVTSFGNREYGDFETLRFVLESAREPYFEFDASSMSDGTLRALAALIAAFQIVLPTGFPGFIAIEEPETALHPGAVRALVDAIDEATLRTQILLTTHSAEMLDNPTIKPENIRVVQMIDGQTVIAPVDEASVEIVRRKLNTLGGLERDNLLEPDIDDLERQKQLQQVASESPKWPCTFH